MDLKKMVIDFHTHTFPDKIASKAIANLAAGSHTHHFSDGTLTGLIESKKKNGIDYVVNLAVATRADQVSHINDGIISHLDAYKEQGIISLGAMHPEFEDYKAELLKLKNAGIKGIKLHPAFCGTDLSDIRFKNIIAEASSLDMIVLTHAGLDIGFLDHDYASIEHILEVMREVKPTKFVLAHMGGWQNWDNVKKYIAGSPLWLDTAFSLGKVAIIEGEEDMMPYKEQLDHEGFVSLVRAHGTDRVLFATDSPWADQGKYMDFVKESGLNEDELNEVMSGNAVKLLGL